MIKQEARKAGKEDGEGRNGFEHGELTDQIIGAAIEVHRRLGPGFPESIYENAVVIELRKRRLRVEQQLPVPVRYDGVIVGEHRWTCWSSGRF